MRRLLEWLQSLLHQYGYAAIFTSLFVNNLGLPVPGTTLLLGAGLLVGEGTLSLPLTVLTGTLACFLGSNGGYWLGRKFGDSWIKKNRWIHPTHQRIKHMEKFFKRYGAKGVFFARFVGFLHPIIGLMSGVGKTPAGPFLYYNLAGSAVYTLIYTLVGEFYGSKWGLHEVWMVHISLYGLLLAVIFALFMVFWRYSINSFLGYVYFKRR